MNESTIAKILNIRVLILDVDGILTPGRVILDHAGHEIKVFDVRDGMGLVLWRQAGFKSFVITARSAPAVEARANDLKMDRIYQNAHPKVKAYQEIVDDFQLRDEEICCMGDDVTDLGILQRCGLSVSVPDAVSEVKDLVDIITRKSGGMGAVREVIELILKTQNRWNDLLKPFYGD